MHAVWSVTDASDRIDEDLEKGVTDTVGTARVLATPLTPTKAEREEHDVSHVPHRLWCRFCHG